MKNIDTAVLDCLHERPGRPSQIVDRLRATGIACDGVTVLAALHRLSSTYCVVARGPVYHDVARLCLDALASRPRSAPELAAIVGVPDPAVRAALAVLQHRGRIERDGGAWRLCAAGPMLPNMARRPAHIAEGA